ncbi:hypothetical protein PV08_04846 [Exophiala spinifera]|uniref:N-acetyltransferase domain-containing protein n=1 Tax=Exophiala spinifera TaxID=91928 RepID=A0A0D1YQZ2_9EURO|nr:uncharacterized protein PV08_04846 [Exophiala spinifera]KIW17651.1 hypothetical protein PV08_04846 [Exophiala spinifera]
MATTEKHTEDTLDVPLATGANISTTSLVTPPSRVPTTDGSGSGSGSNSTPTTPPPPPPPPPARPRMTTSRSEYYQEKLAEIYSRATVDDALNVVFEQDKNGSSTGPVTASMLYPASRARVATKVKAGSFVAEAADFAAVVCWEPPDAVARPLSEPELQELAKGRPVFAKFVRDQQAARAATFGTDQPYWNMTLMARDPERSDRGAVRAVIEPFVARARKDGVPMWLCAANERARDVYAYFGFRVVEVIYSVVEAKGDGDADGDADQVDQQGKNKKKTIVPTWCMCCNWPVEPVREKEDGQSEKSGNGKGNGL